MYRLSVLIILVSLQQIYYQFSLWPQIYTTGGVLFHIHLTGLQPKVTVIVFDDDWYISIGLFVNDRKLSCKFHGVFSIVRYRCGLEPSWVGLRC